jgi:urease accessory protein
MIMNKKISGTTFGLFCIVFPTLSLAHGGSGTEGFMTGLAHPFTGLDHLLTALACGLWMKLRLNLSPGHGMGLFLLPLLAGMLLGANGIQGLYLEGLLIACVFLLAVLLAPGIHTRTSLGIALATGFALLQGLAHGGEIISLSLQGSLAALAVTMSTGILLAGGYALAAAARKHRPCVEIRKT